MQVPRIFWLIFAALCLFSSEAGVFLDQEFVAATRSAYQVYKDQYWGQSFTVGKTGKLVRIMADMNADYGLRTDMTAVLINQRSGLQKSFTIPFWKVRNTTQDSLNGIDVSGLNFTVSAGDVCQ